MQHLLETGTSMAIWAVKGDFYCHITKYTTLLPD
jgi:hypothetical protein